MGLILAALFLLPLPALAHDGLNWPASYRNTNGTPCCTLTERHGDCTELPYDTGAGLGLGSVITATFPNGRTQAVVINAVFTSESNRVVVCATGCLFAVAGG